ncbi:uncharacterized protein LOC143001659 [Genypterus blacodes]|uniref:uncharacterized protein LOC143001659 n=1 Tax=Genypterus blacodes TaxID=154954 RepID=UPI003F7722CE
MERRTRRLENELCRAVKDGEPRCVQLLLSQGAQPDCVGGRGVAAVHLAAGRETEKNTRCLKLLLQHGADPNIRSSEGLTPLHIAAVWGCFQNLKLLLTNGGNPNIKDQEGNTARQLAEQQENRKCAQLLQEYQASSVDAEEELPRFQYSVYSDQTDTSGYPESDSSFSSHSSMLSDFGDGVLSSTRRSSFFNLSAIHERPSCRGGSYQRLYDVDNRRNQGDWNAASAWSAEGPSILSSTRMSAVGSGHPLPILKEDNLFIDDCLTSTLNKYPANPNVGISPSRRDTLPAFPSRRASRKSVSFRDVDEYFPVFSPGSPKRQPVLEASQCPDTLPFDLTDYSSFFDSERMATVLQRQGIDVTSPDNVYVFCRESSESAEEVMEKTVISPLSLEDNDIESENVKECQVNLPQQPACNSGGSSSSSQYSSCDSDHYTSALDATTHHRLLSSPALNPQCVTSDDNIHMNTNTDFASARRDGNFQLSQTEPQGDSSLESVDNSPDTDHKRALSNLKTPNNHVLESSRDSKETEDASSETGNDEVTAGSQTPAAVALNEDLVLPLTPSPFVTGRTRSRLSRCSLRTSKPPDSLFSTSSLFEETLPTPLRTRRQTPRSQRSDEDFYNSPLRPCYTPSYTESSTTNGEHFASECADTQPSTLTASSCTSESESQADTLILPKGLTDSVCETQTLSDTIVLEKNQDSSIDAYERNLQEIVQAMRAQRLEGRDFLTDDLTSADEATTKGMNDAPELARPDNLNNGDTWLTEEGDSQPESVYSSSSSSYFSPRKSRESSDPSTPGTGCTPRYSMSRLSGCRRPQHLANLSYTPGGRPLLQDLDEPVEYLYTDIEQGHELIEVHVPPTANTSLSSSMSTSSSDETVLYDWRSMCSDRTDGGKENQKPQKAPRVEEKDAKEVIPQVSLPETSGITDKELRCRLLELGESPGPISSRTRPTYMRRLCRLLQESKSQLPQHRKLSDQSHTDSGYSPELGRALQTFQLPNCHTDEQALCQQFDQPDQNRKWREGIIKSSFNYLLLDPRVTKNLPFRSHTMSPHECFQSFVGAIFYVGKGKRSRPYSHLYEALEYHKGDKTSKKLSRKVQHILQVWSAEQGVISLHCFQNVIPVEAYTREACMVEAMGLKVLTNQKRGDYYGVVSTWQAKRKRELGVHLLYRAMQIFLAEGERQLRPADIRQ